MEKRLLTAIAYFPILTKKKKKQNKMTCGLRFENNMTASVCACVLLRFD